MNRKTLIHPEIHSGDPRNLTIWSPEKGKWLVDDHGKFYPKGVDGGNAPFEITVPTRELAVVLRQAVIDYYIPNKEKEDAGKRR